MSRLLIGTLVLLGVLFAGWLRGPQPPAEDDLPPAADEPAAPPPTENSSPESPPVESPESPRSMPRRSPRSRPESNLPTRDLVLRKREDGELTPTEQILNALSSAVEVEASGQTLRQVLKDLASKTQINLFLVRDDLPKNESASPFDEPVNLVTPPIKFEAVLDRLLPHRKLGWMVREDALWILDSGQIELLQEVRTFEVAPLLRAGHSPQELVAAIRGVGAGRQRPGCEVGLSGGVLFARHNQPGLRSIAGVLANLDELAEDDETQSRRKAAPEARRPRPPARILPATFRPADDRPPGEIDAEGLLLDALDSRRDVDFHGKILHECLTELCQEAGVPFVIDFFEGSSAQEPGNADDLETPQHPWQAWLRRPVELSLRNVRLESILVMLLEPRDLDWVNRHDVMWFVNRDEAKNEIETKAYDVANLLETGHDPLDLAEAIQRTVAPGTWTQRPGEELPPEGFIAVTGEVLVVRQTQRVHWELAQVLAELDALADEAAAADDLDRDQYTWESHRIPTDKGEELANSIRELIAPASWRPTVKGVNQRPGGEIRAFPGLLLVWQTRSRQAQIRQLLRGSAD